MVLGYTRTGIAVLLPTSRAMDSEMFTGWSRGDHADAARILREGGDRESFDPDLRTWCTHWAKAHRELGKTRKNAVQLRGSADVAILAGGRRRR